MRTATCTHLVSLWAVLVRFLLGKHLRYNRAVVGPWDLAPLLGLVPLCTRARVGSNSRLIVIQNWGRSPRGLRAILPTVETAIVWLFLLQAVRVLFSSWVGVIYDVVFDQSLDALVVVVDIALILLAMLAPALLSRFEGQAWSRVAAVLLVAGSRFFVSVHDPSVRLYASIILLGGAAFYVSHVFLHEPSRLMTGLLVGLAAEQMLRAFDFSFDPSLRPEGLLLVLAFGVVLVVISSYLARENVTRVDDQPGLIGGLALGAGLFTQISLLGLPNAVSRWTGSAYGLTAPLLILITLMPLVPAARGVEWHLGTFLWPMSGQVAIVVVLLCIALAALLGGPLGFGFLLIAQLVFVFTFTTAVSRLRSPRGKCILGLETSLGLLLLFGLSLAFAFTFTYAYTFGFFRGLGTPVLLLGTFVAMLPVVRISRAPEYEINSLRPSSVVLVGIALLSLLCAAMLRSQYPSDELGARHLRLATFNIHHGYGRDWAFNLHEIRDTISDLDVDVVVLQEVDTGRVTSFSVDQALWLSNRLSMYCVYQPTLEKLSGIALLSRYPLLRSGGELLSSSLEQTAIVHGAVDFQGNPLDVYGVWLGLKAAERAAQLSEVLEYIGDAYPAALGGDMNASPDSPAYSQLIAAGFLDPFDDGDDRAPAPISAENATERIDYVMLRGLTQLQSWVADTGASDHPIVGVEVRVGP
jgi:endonuclease/exonuclease/phosphatase family metal-dependent hydrolase